MNKDFSLHLKRGYQTLKILPNFLSLGQNNINPVLILRDGYIELRVVFRLKKILISEIADVKRGPFENYVVIIPKTGIFKYIFVMDEAKTAQIVIESILQ